MSLLFSRLTQDFITFGTTMKEASDPTFPGQAEAQASLPAAAAAFKHSAALNASYLVYIGKPSFLTVPCFYRPNFAKVSACSFARTPTWSSGFTRAK